MLANSGAAQKVNAKYIDGIRTDRIEGFDELKAPRKGKIGGNASSTMQPVHKPMDLVAMQKEVEKEETE